MNPNNVRLWNTYYTRVGSKTVPVIVVAMIDGVGRNRIRNRKYLLRRPGSIGYLPLFCKASALKEK